MSKKFYYCEICGNIVEKVHDSGNDLTCCNQTMKELIPGVTEGKVEYHIPVCEHVKKNVLEVRIGKEMHPMEDEHYIQWIEVITDKGEMRRRLHPGDEPVVRFHLCDDEKVCGVYAYCNKHKLWKA